jgi:6-phosphogluconate dehydrogenase
MAGVSGGEEGALLGPSIMPGGNPAAWLLVKEIFQKISAKVEDNGVESPCCEWVCSATISAVLLLYLILSSSNIDHLH